MKFEAKPQTFPYCAKVLWWWWGLAWTSRHTIITIIIFMISMHLRGFSRWHFPQLWLVFNLDVHCIICVKLIYIFSLKLWFQSKLNIWNVSILGKMTNLTSKTIIYLLAWLCHRLFWNKLAKNVRIYVLKNFVEPFMSKSNFFLNKCTKACWSHLNSPNIS